MSRHEKLPDWIQGLPSIIQEYYLEGKLKNANPDFLRNCEVIQDKRMTSTAIERFVKRFKKRGLNALPEATHQQRNEELVDSARWLLGGAGKDKKWRLGSGGMGEVYYGYDTVMENQVAIKILAHGRGDRELPEAIEREAKTIARLNHPCLPRIYDFFVDKGRYMYSMELLDEDSGYKPLENRIEKFQQPEILTTMAGLCEVIDYCWKRGIVHRDLKPGNMLVDEKGNLKVIDFGMSSWVFPGNDSAIWGSTSYMSPERLNSIGDDSLTIESEIFTAGTILYEMMTGDVLYSGSGLHDITEVLDKAEPLAGAQERKLRQMAQALGFDSDAIVDLINKAHARDPLERFHSGQEFFVALSKARRK